MVIILAGCDGTGKSTCFNKLRKTIEGNYIKESYTSDVYVKIIRSLFVAQKTKDNDLTVYDRATILDDIVYEQVMSKHPSLISLHFNHRELMSIFKDVLIIYFDLDNGVLEKRLEQRGDSYITVKQINEIKESYEKVFKTYQIHPIRLSVTNMNEEEVYNKIKEIINEKFKNS